MYPTLSPRLFLSFLLITVITSAQFARSTNTPSNKDSVQRGLNLAKGGHCAEALSVLRKATPLIREKAIQRDAGLAGLRCAMLRNEFGAAQDFLSLLSREFPRDPEVLYVTVHTYSDLATRASQMLATSAPNSAQAHELNAESLEMQGKWDLAEKEYQTILQQNPRQPGIHFRMGRLLLSKPNPPPTVAEDAKKEFQQELEIDPNNAGAEYVLGELSRQAQQWDEAIQHFSQAAKLDAGFGDAFLGLGSTLISQKKFADAVSPLEKAVKLEPQNPAAHYNLATAYVRTGRKQDADKEFAVHRAMMQKNGEHGAEQEPQTPVNPQ
jgi:tetratricopeptide (TPR) repeat protein